MNKILIPPKGAAGLGLKSTLYAWYALDESSGNRADSHTSGITLNDINTVTSAAGVGGVGTSALFTASNSEYLNGSGTIDFSGGDISLNIWVYVVSKPAVTYTTVYHNRRADYFYYDISANKIDSLVNYANGDSKTLVGSALSLNTWYMLTQTFAYTSGLATLYINATSVATNSDIPGIGYGAGNPVYGMRLGQNGVDYDAYWDGRMAKFGIWKSSPDAGGCLTQAQVILLYNSGAGRVYTEL